MHLNIPYHNVSNFFTLILHKLAIFYLSHNVGKTPFMTMCQGGQMVSIRNLTLLEIKNTATNFPTALECRGISVMTANILTCVVRKHARQNMVIP